MASDKRKGFGRLLLAVSQSWRRALTQHLSKEGVSGTAALLVLEMLHLGSRQLRQYELARRLGLENSAVVRLLDGLENSGFVCRQEDPVDRRAKLLSLTKRGLISETGWITLPVACGCKFSAIFRRKTSKSLKKP